MDNEKDLLQWKREKRKKEKVSGLAYYYKHE